jgi:hypothetical protein
MVWPVRSLPVVKVSGSSGAEPLMNSRMFAQASRVSEGLGQQAHVQRGHAHEHGGARQARAITALGSNFSSHRSSWLPFSSAPWLATNRPCTWKIGSAWISTSPPQRRRQPQ